MKKVLALLLLIFLTIAMLPVIGWWLTLQPEPVIRNHSENKIGRTEIDKISQQLGVQGLSNSSGRTIQLRQQDLNTLIQYGSQQLTLPVDISAALTLHPQQSTLRSSIDTRLALRPYLNITVHFTTQGRELILQGGKIGAFELPQQSMSLLMKMAYPYMQSHPQYNNGQTLWQTIKDIRIGEAKVSIELENDHKLGAQLQQQHIESLVGRDALARLPHYQRLLADRYRSHSGRVALNEALQFLFNEATTANSGDPVADNKAILLSLFLHTSPAQKFSQLPLDSSIQLPTERLIFSLERRKDLAQHFLATATITLFANSALADAIGMFKELQDRNGPGTFDPADLVADRAGTVLAEKLTQDINSAEKYQRRLAELQSVEELLPATRTIVPEVENILVSHYPQEQQLKMVEQAIDNHVQRATIYQ